MNMNYKKYLQFVIPSVLSMALAGVYSIVDGFFVGHSVGDLGLSTINVAYPVEAFVQALGTGIGMGGAVHYMIFHASGDEEEAGIHIKCMSWLLLFTSLAATVLLLVWVTPLLSLLGARGDMIPMGKTYLQVIIGGSILQIFGTGVVPMIRNYGGAGYAMGAMLSGFGTNIVLDYLMVWVLDWGVFGAGLATILGEGVTAVAGLLYLFRKKSPLFRIPHRQVAASVRRILGTGIAPFGLTFSPILSLIVMNRISMIYGGESAVAVYACVAYATSIVYLVLQGVGDGSQPLISRAYGSDNRSSMRSLKKQSYATAGILALLSILVFMLIRSDIGRMFGASASVNQTASEITPIFCIGFLFVAFVRVTSSVFYATSENMKSYLLVYAEPVFLLILSLFVPQLAGLSGVWWSYCGAQILSGAAAALLLLLERLRRQR
jgi:Na+-driven multidrug efflux pump